MQYVGKVGGYMYNQWNSLNPATLSGAIDIIVVEHSDGTLHCSPWHVRFGKFRIIKPSQKKIDLYVNGQKTDLPMKLGDGGEAFFVFETDSKDLSSSLMTSPVISAQSSPEMGPVDDGGNNEDENETENEHENENENENYIDEENGVVRKSRKGDNNAGNKAGRNGTPDPVKVEPELLDLNHNSKLTHKDIEKKIKLSDTSAAPKNDAEATTSGSGSGSESVSSSVQRLTFEKVKRITQDLNIPSKIDVNGDVILDMDGYKPNSQKNIDSSDKLVHGIFLKEMNAVLNGSEWAAHDKSDDHSHAQELRLLQSLVKKDKDGQIRIVYDDNEFEVAASEADGDGDGENEHDNENIAPANLTIPPEQTEVTQAPVVDHVASDKTYIKTLRLTSEQLMQLNLQYGRNRLVFRSPQGGSQVESDLYLWKSNIPIVISDIDGTITKSDALGHVLNMFGKDWTHPGVANLFQDIGRNGYNIMYLTARSVGQADTTRQYLDSINQDGMRLPKGPVILSPDRTMAALRREIILKKPEVFKMACLRDIHDLFFSRRDSDTDSVNAEDERTPFYAGFGNRITDAISYRSVKIPSHRIFTINPNGEVHMELLELAGYKSSYLHIGELVDQFFPPLKYISDFSQGWNQHQLDQYIHSKDAEYENSGSGPGSGPGPGYAAPMSPGSPRSVHSDDMNIPDERYTDLNYWRDPIPDLSDSSEDDGDADGSVSVKSASKSNSGPPSPKQAVYSPPTSPHLLASEVLAEAEKRKDAQNERPVSTSFTSPLKNFMIGASSSTPAPKPMKSPLNLGPGLDDRSTHANVSDDIDEDDDYTDDYDDDDYDDVDAGEDEDEDEDDEDDDEDDEEDEDDEDDDEDEDDLDDDEVHYVEAESAADVDADADAEAEVEADDDDLDLDDGLPEESPNPPNTHTVYTPTAEDYGDQEYRIMTASDMLKSMDI